MKLRRRWAFGLVCACVLALLAVLRWGGDLPVVCSPLPSHAEAAVVLQGSVAGEMARVAGAVELLRSGVVDEIVLSVPRQSYWGESVPDAARAYMERTYGPSVSSRLVFCETGPEVDSTQQESEALRPCLMGRGLRSILVVTSNYHTRRAGRIWRAVFKNTPIQLRVHGVNDPEYQARGWWRKRLWAKTWFYEITKLVAEAV